LSRWSETWRRLGFVSSVKPWRVGERRDCCTALKEVTALPRKTFYQLGADLFGDDYWERAAADSAKSIRDWAAKKRAGPARRGRKPRARQGDNG